MQILISSGFSLLVKVPVYVRGCQSARITLTLVDAPGHIAQSVTCLTPDTCLTADQVVVNSILARTHTFVEINHGIISTAILLPSADSNSFKLSVTSKSMCTKYWLTA